MSDPVDLSVGPSDTVLDLPSEVASGRLRTALAAPAESRRDAVADVVRAFPDWSQAWADLGGLGRDDVEAYACFRVGYHRGLDALRRAGWRGSGYVRWAHPSNRGFLLCLEGLRAMAAAIGEPEEEQRCALFLRQLDPAWPPEDRDSLSAGTVR
ncbi:MAG: DUF3151 family protein [Acidimicrobiales bacterium]